MKNVLLIVTELDSANGICAKAVINEFRKRGNTVYCITNYEKKRSSKWKEEDVTFFTVRPRIVYSLQKRIENERNEALKRLLSVVFLLINKSKLLLSYPFWPLISLGYSNRIYKKAKKICNDYAIDVIIPVYTQIDTIIAANRIKKQNSEIMYIPYMLDSLAAGYGPRYFSKEWVEKRGLKWEKKLFLRSDRIIMMASSKVFYDNMKNELDYYRKIYFLDIPLFIKKENTIKNRKKDVNHVIKLVYVGSIPFSIRDPRYFINTFSMIPKKNVELIFVGSTDNDNLMKKLCNVDKRISFIGRVSHDEALEYIKNADVLVNIGNNNISMTPSKIFEYISYGKPIISTLPVPEEPSVKYLKEYPLSFFVDEKAETLEQAKCMYDFILENAGRNLDVEELVNAFHLNSPSTFVDYVIGESI